MKDKFLGLVVVALVGVIWFQRGCEADTTTREPDTLVVRDTMWNTYEKTIVKTVPVEKEVLVPQEIIKYKADGSYDKLKVQYDELVKKYTSKKTYKDTVKVGDYGDIKIVDTVANNTLVGRQITENYKIPEVTETKTITKYAPPTRQVYVGGGINASSIKSVTGAEGGVLYKNKKDQIFGGKVYINVDGSVGFGVSSYWKIKTNK